MEAWSKGVVWVNGVNIGRYWSVGPQQTLYIPAPSLRVGLNEFVIFEELAAPKDYAIKFVAGPIWKTKTPPMVDLL
jgi:beta-galactosidase